MTIREAETAMRRPLTFGDLEQIEAVEVIALRDELNRFHYEDCVMLTCSGCKDGCHHEALGKWDAEILHAQIARAKLLLDEGPVLTLAQCEALQRA